MSSFNVSGQIMAAAGTHEEVDLELGVIAMPDNTEPTALNSPDDDSYDNSGETDTAGNSSAVSGDPIGERIPVPEQNPLPEGQTRTTRNFSAVSEGAFCVSIVVPERMTQELQQNPQLQGRFLIDGTSGQVRMLPSGNVIGNVHDIVNGHIVRNGSEVMEPNSGVNDLIFSGAIYGCVANLAGVVTKVLHLVYTGEKEKDTSVVMTMAGITGVLGIFTCINSVILKRKNNKFALIVAKIGCSASVAMLTCVASLLLTNYFKCIPVGLGAVTIANIWIG